LLGSRGRLSDYGIGKNGADKHDARRDNSMGAVAQTRSIEWNERLWKRKAGSGLGEKNRGGNVNVNGRTIRFKEKGKVEDSIIQSVSRERGLQLAIIPVAKLGGGQQK